MTLSVSLLTWFDSVTLFLIAVPRDFHVLLKTTEKTENFMLVLLTSVYEFVL